MDGPPVPVSLWRGGDGQAASVGGGGVHRAQSDGRGAGEPFLAGHGRAPRAELAGEDDELATVAPLRALISNFAAILAMPADAAATRIERIPATGRPLGRPEWSAMLERRLDLPLAPANPAQNREWSRTPRDQRS